MNFFSTPISPWASIKSPSLKGLKIIIKAPPAKLDKDPCKAKPTAKPAAPTMAANEVVATPNLEITSIFPSYYLTSYCEIINPSPIPLTFLSLVSIMNPKSLNSFFWLSSEIPTPVSST